MGYANGCMDGWIPECMNGRDGMGWDGYPNGWMAESPEAKTPNGRVCPMAGRQNACHMGMGKEKDRKK